MSLRWRPMWAEAELWAVASEHVQEQFREQIMNGLRAEGPKVMNALNAYVKDHATEWEQQSGQVLREDLRVSPTAGRIT